MPDVEDQLIGMISQLDKKVSAVQQNTDELCKGLVYEGYRIDSFLHRQSTSSYTALVPLLFGAMMGSIAYWTSQMITKGRWDSLALQLPLYVLTAMFVINGWLYFNRALVWHKESPPGEALTFLLGLVWMVSIIVFANKPDFWPWGAACVFPSILLVAAKVWEVACALRARKESSHPLYHPALVWARIAVAWCLTLLTIGLVGKFFVNLKKESSLCALTVVLTIVAFGVAVFITCRVSAVLLKLEEEIKGYLSRSATMEQTGTSSTPVARPKQGS